jgi:hypothetical protein
MLSPGKAIMLNSNNTDFTGGMGQVVEACLASTRPQVQSSVTQKYPQILVSGEITFENVIFLFPNMQICASNWNYLHLNFFSC